jgi:hypothetical protein
MADDAYGEAHEDDPFETQGALQTQQPSAESAVHEPPSRMVAAFLGKQVLVLLLPL